MLVDVAVADVAARVEDTLPRARSRRPRGTRRSDALRLHRGDAGRLGASRGGARSVARRYRPSSRLGARQRGDHDRRCERSPPCAASKGATTTSCCCPGLPRLPDASCRQRLRRAARGRHRSRRTAGCRGTRALGLTYQHRPLAAEGCSSAQPPSGAAAIRTVLAFSSLSPRPRHGPTKANDLRDVGQDELARQADEDREQFLRSCEGVCGTRRSSCTEASVRSQHSCRTGARSSPPHPAPAARAPCSCGEKTHAAGRSSSSSTTSSPASPASRRPTPSASAQPKSASSTSTPTSCASSSPTRSRTATGNSRA